MGSDRAAERDGVDSSTVRPRRPTASEDGGAVLFGVPNTDEPERARWDSQVSFNLDMGGIF